MTQENWTAARYGARAGEFIRSASVLCSNLHDGWLPSAGLLLGFSCELLAKRRLIHQGNSEDRLRHSPYGHNILGMWKNETTLYAEAEEVVEQLKMNSRQDGLLASFDWELHFHKLADGHSNSSDYSLRYHQGDIRFADPEALVLVLGRIWVRENEISLNWSRDHASD